MTKNAYLCRAKQTVRAKAYASALDLRLNAPSRGIQSCQTEQPGLCVSSRYRMSAKTAQLSRLCIVNQYGSCNTVYCFS